MDAMTQKLFDTFAKALGVDAGRITPELGYNTIPEWDSVAHMVLIAQIEEAFDVMLDTDEIIDMSSPAKAIDILKAHNIDIS